MKEITQPAAWLKEIGRATKQRGTDKLRQVKEEIAAMSFSRSLAINDLAS